MLLNYFLRNRPEIKRKLIKSQMFIMSGMTCCAIAIILERYISEISIIDFLQGMFIGMSIVFMITGLIYLRIKKV